MLILTRQPGGSINFGDATLTVLDAAGGECCIAIRLRGETIAVAQRPNDAIRVGAGITIKVLEIHGNRVRLGFVAPMDVQIARDDCRCTRRLHGTFVEDDGSGASHE